MPITNRGFDGSATNCLITKKSHKRQMSHGGGGRGRVQKVSRIIWMVPFFKSFLKKMNEPVVLTAFAGIFSNGPPLTS